jgi:hypothetical protein
MHSFKSESTPITFHHNGDFSGDAILVIPNGMVTYDGIKVGELPQRLRDGITVRPGQSVELEIPMQALLELVAEAVRSQRISEIEQATPEQLLGVKL